MKLFYTADTHLFFQHLPRSLFAAGKLDVDILIFGGDLMPVDIRQEQGKIKDCIVPQGEWLKNVFLPAIEAFKKQFPEKIICFDFGNDDLLANRRFLEIGDGKSHHLIHNNIIELAPGIALVGYMNIPLTPFMLKDWEIPDREDHLGRGQNLRKKGIKTGSGKARDIKLKKITITIEQQLAGLTDEMNCSRWDGYNFIFVSHCPPADTNLDLMYGNHHVGSESIRSFIEQWAASGRLLTTLHGHIHESPALSGRVWDFLGSVPCFNVGQKENVLQALFLDVGDRLDSVELVRVDSHSLNRKALSLVEKSTDENMPDEVWFLSKTKEFYLMSNFAETSFTIDGKEWPTVEHYYQAHKACRDRPGDAILVASSETALKAMRNGRKIELRPDWEQVKEEIMLTALRAKFAQHQPSLDLLLSTGNRELHENNPKDLYWSGHGKDRLGQLLMQVRKELLAAVW